MNNNLHFRLSIIRLDTKTEKKFANNFAASNNMKVIIKFNIIYKMSFIYI